jgi:hypothetical protein
VTCIATIGCAFAEAQLGALLTQHGLARELDAVAFDGKDFYQYLVAIAQLILHARDPVLGDLRDVQQAVGAGEYLHKGAELCDADDFAEVGLADLRHSGDVGDHLDGLREAVGVGGRNVHAAGVVHVDLDASGIDDAADDLAAGSDEVADLVGWDLDGVDARREL